MVTCCWFVSRQGAFASWRQAGTCTGAGPPDHGMVTATSGWQLCWGGQQSSVLMCVGPWGPLGP